MMDGLLSNGLEGGIVGGHPTHHDSQTWVVRCVKPCRGDEYIHRHPTVKVAASERRGVQLIRFSMPTFRDCRFDSNPLPQCKNR